MRRPAGNPRHPASSSRAGRAEEYEVGYGKPPVNTRFRKGQSGNPKGRPRGSKGVTGLVNSALDETINVAENGRPRSIMKRQAILLSMITKAIKGDVRAAALVLKLMELHDPSPKSRDGQISHEDWLDLMENDVQAQAERFTKAIQDLADRENALR